MPLWFLLSFAGLAAAAESPLLDHLIRLDGTSFYGVIERIDAKGRFQLVRSANEIDLDGLLAIDRPAWAVQSPLPAPDCAVELLGGGRVMAHDLTIRNQECRLVLCEAGELRLPVEMIAGIYFGRPPEVKNEKLAALLAEPKKDVDRLLVKIGDKLETIEGLIEGLDDKQATVEWQGKSRKVPRESIVGIALAVVGKPPDHAGQCLVTTRLIGSSFWGRIVEMQNGELTVELAPNAITQIAWGNIQRVEVRSTRLAWLSDLKPLEATEEPIVTLPMPWQRDKSVGGKKLTIAGRTFDKGIGVHARSLLRFAAEGKYDQFAATIGIDAETAGQGDCEFVVLADSRELYRQRVTGHDPPRDIQLDIRAAREVTLLVEPGADLNLADHADWANARLLRKGETR